MRYKNNVLQILDNVDATVLKVQFGINRGGTQDQILNTIDELKNKGPLEVIARVNVEKKYQPSS